MFPSATTVLLLVGLVTGVMCAPAPAPTLNKSPSNRVTLDDDEYLSKEEREQVVAGIILQIARDFDEGYITQDELFGRSSAHEDDFGRKGKEESELNKEDVPPETPPHTSPQTAALAT